jgi:hypothetical protein
VSDTRALRAFADVGDSLVGGQRQELDTFGRNLSDDVL